MKLLVLIYSNQIGLFMVVNIISSLCCFVCSRDRCRLATCRRLVAAEAVDITTVTIIIIIIITRRMMRSPVVLVILPDLTVTPTSTRILTATTTATAVCRFLSSLKKEHFVCTLYCIHRLLLAPAAANRLPVFIISFLPLATLLEFLGYVLAHHFLAQLHEQKRFNHL